MSVDSQDARIEELGLGMMGWETLPGLWQILHCLNPGTRLIVLREQQSTYDMIFAVTGIWALDISLKVAAIYQIPRNMSVIMPGLRKD